MFAGSSKLTIDDKGRLAIPARLRAQLVEDYGKQVAVTLGPECIEIYPAEVFRRMADAIQKIPDRTKRVTMQRLFVGHAVLVDLDAQGRILIPPLLREAKQLDSEVVLAGVNDHFELWPEAQWATSMQAAQAVYADAFAALSF